MLRRSLALLAVLSVAASATAAPDPTAWTHLPTAGAPSAREHHALAWTGREAIVWGGSDGSGALGDGARYDPAARTWTAIRAKSPLRPRFHHGAVWTGRRLVVFGGTDGARELGDGAAYDPTTDSWTTISPDGAPSPRCQHATVWTGREVLVWGGTADGRGVGTGAAYDPATDRWRPMRMPGAPRPRHAASAVWTGQEMIVWGGLDRTSWLGDGARYDPKADRWNPVSEAESPWARAHHAAVWDGKAMFVFGGYGGRFSERRELDGWSYHPGPDRWLPITSIGAPASRRGHVVAWTGTAIWLVGGTAPAADGSGAARESGAAYDPTVREWRALTPFAPRAGARSAWTGRAWIVWGGLAPESAPAGAQLDVPTSD